MIRGEQFGIAKIANSQLSNSRLPSDKRGETHCRFVMTFHFVVGLCVALGLFLTLLSLSDRLGLRQAKKGETGGQCKNCTVHCCAECRPAPTSLSLSTARALREPKERSGVTT